MKQFTVIGLGNFGYYLATNLFEKGHDVLAIDKHANPVQEIKDKVSRAVVCDAADPKALSELGLKTMDAVIVCIGSILSNSILVTLNLKELGVRNIIAKAISEPHGRILQKIGAMDVYFPEKDSALSLANHLHNPNVIEYLPFLEGFSIIQLAPPRKFIGKTLKELDLINRFGVQVVAIKEIIPENINMIPTGNFVIKDSDVVFLLGPDESLEKLQEEAR
ncbi:MAG: TrkA family potassium uptake protein [Proteobacteria bacterium]|nr:TrkA family potassium uptake protein [Pseudomonadota bacterium]